MAPVGRSGKNRVPFNLSVEEGAAIASKQSVFKIIFIGDEGVGKTSLVARYATSQFKADYLPTLGANVVAKEYSYENRILTLLVWDIAGQEMFSQVRDKYYGGTSMAVLVYDVTSKKTLTNTKNWLADMRSAASANTPLLLVGNKTDLPNRSVSREDGEKLARELGASFLETSAKTGENVRKLFDVVAKLLIDRYG
jgi:small GTP-binding protein